MQIKFLLPSTVGAQRGGDITGADETSGFWGHFHSLNFDFLNVS